MLPAGCFKDWESAGEMNACLIGDLAVVPLRMDQ